jgi:hypothetical protein
MYIPSQNCEIPIYERNPELRRSNDAQGNQAIGQAVAHFYHQPYIVNNKTNNSKVTTQSATLPFIHIFPSLRKYTPPLGTLIRHRRRHRHRPMPGPRSEIITPSSGPDRWRHRSRALHKPFQCCDGSTGKKAAVAARRRRHRADGGVADLTEVRAVALTEVRHSREDVAADRAWAGRGCCGGGRRRRRYRRVA